MSYTLVPSELIVDGAITSAKLDTNISVSGTLGVTGEVTLATHLNMGDNDKIKIGTGGDLEIYHDGSNSYISNSTGNIYLADTNGAVHIQAKLNEESIVASADGAVTLYHDNSAKLATASGGVTVTGTLTATTLAGTLSTAAQPNITSVGTLTGFTSTGIDDNADATAITIDSNENVGFGVSPRARLDIFQQTNRTSKTGTTRGVLHLQDGDTAANNELTAITFESNSNNASAIIGQSLTNNGSELFFGTSNGYASGVTNTAMIINPSGNVGIGTNPDKLLHLAASSGATLRLESTTTGATTGDIFGAIEFETQDSNSAGVKGKIDSYSEGNVGNAALRFFTGNTTELGERMRIDSNGQVMIGHTSSFAHADADNLAIGDGTNNSGLTIYTGASKESSIIFGNAGTNGNIEAGIKYYHESHGTVANRRAMTFATGGSMAERMRITSDGSIGFGTTNPSSFGGKNFEFSDTSTAQTGVRITCSAGSGEIGLDNTGVYIQSVTVGDGVTLYSSNSGAADTIALKIFSTGEARHFSHTANTLVLNTSSNAAGTNNLIRAYSDSSNTVDGNVRFVVLPSGNVQNSNNSYGQISDRSLKENIVDTTSKLDKIKQVRIRNFNFIGDDLKQIGVVAQELETVFPNLVETIDDQDMGLKKSVKYSVFVPILIKAIQEQQEQIETLKAEVQELKDNG
jgi:hypothetical protein